jgi:hypothetical protein
MIGQAASPSNEAHGIIAANKEDVLLAVRKTGGLGSIA